ncbi:MULTISPECIES: hypothetical protein [unclassified Saccharicrinis]|uniref:hypothetical protein n=1 Tax=unclassified Saccharicrinis TaxID=2646859 RepID=UPI003D32F5D1
MFKKIWRYLKGNNDKEAQSYYTPMTKHYVFNETGNIMLCATTDSIQNFDQDIKDSFIDVSVFFTAMTKAVHSVKNDVTDKPFTIYNYQAVKNILNQSGMFIEMNVEEGVFSHKGVGGPMGKELIQTVLNRNFSDSKLNFSKSMFNGMAYQVKGVQDKQNLSDRDRKLCRSGNIFFICELLLGLPQTTAVLVNIESKSIDEKSQKDNDAKDIFELGKVDERTHQYLGIEREWKFKKRTYLFAPPKFLKNNITALSDANAPEFDDLIEALADRLVKQVKEQG